MFRKILEVTLLALFKLVFMVRYRVKVKGLENLSKDKLKKPGGVLILPNHPTVMIDPVLVGVYTWKRFQPRPIVVEYMYYNPGIRWLMDLIYALPIPNFSATSNSVKRRRSQKAIEGLIDALKGGDNVILYPAGKTKRSGYEEIGGSSGLHRIFQKVDDLNVVLVRTTGLWGSSFSRAPTGHPAKLFPVLKAGIVAAIKNLIFLTPKREVTIELSLADETFPIRGRKMEINRWLEEWYNRPFGTPEGEPVSLIPYSYWNPVIPKIEYKGRHHLVDHQDVSDVSEEVRKDILGELARLSDRSLDEVSSNMTLSSDLGLDSLDVADMAAYLSENYGIKGLTTEDLSTVSQLISIAAKGDYKPRQGASVELKTPKDWVDSRQGEVSVSEGETLIEAFLQTVSRFPKGLAIGSDQSGVLNYRQALQRVLILAIHLKKLPGSHVGLMLPATAAADLVVLALILAGKVPVMINWTQGPRHLEAVVRMSKIEVCLTSWAFIERIEGVDFGPLDDMIMMLEEMRTEFSLFDKIRAGMNSYRSPKAILNSFGSDKLSKDDQAVILFTSGTEAEPKGVPLTHGNILSNLRSALKVLKIDYTDRILAILPPFHSFGFTVTGMLPMVSGVPVATFPDPADGARVAQSVQRWKATIIAGAPSFLNGMFQSSAPVMLESLRIVVTGAEKAPKPLLEHAKRNTPEALFVEGYGITECSPILSISLDAYETGNGVGKPIPGVSFLVVHPDTHEKLLPGERGLLLCRGPNVFSGYLEAINRDPFIEIEGERWYDTGDLGYFDPDGNLILAGREKRFAKIGGEMVSLTAIEDAILAAAPDFEWPILLDGPSLAVIADEESQKTVLTLCSTFDVTSRQINKVLNSAGFSNLVRISAVKQIEKVPLMGSGKVNYRRLDQM